MQFIRQQLTLDDVSEPTLEPLAYYKIVPEAFAPEWGTLHASCFDLRACLPPNTGLVAYGQNNIKYSKASSDEEIPQISIQPFERVLVPTGLILDIPVGCSVRLHSRSGFALKQGLVLANHEGVIDSDYVDPTYILVTNTSTVPVTIAHGDRIAQGEMILDHDYEIFESFYKPQKKTDRSGGLGSTGVK